MHQYFDTDNTCATSLHESTTEYTIPIEEELVPEGKISHSLRRHYEQKRKKYVERWMRTEWNAMKGIRIPDKTVGKFAKTRRPCSCWACKRPRYDKRQRRNNIIKGSDE